MKSVRFQDSLFEDCLFEDVRSTDTVFENCTIRSTVFYNTGGFTWRGGAVGRSFSFSCFSGPNSPAGI